MREMSRRGDFEQVLIHTGQHYDRNMSDVLFKDLGLPTPDEFLGVGSGSHAEQTARVLLAFEPTLLKYRPDWVVVVGDVNSTLACSLVAAKCGFPVAHVEAGLRSGDRTMPEEINRVLTDQISDLLLTPSPDADENLVREGISPTKIRRVGNVMIDTLIRLLPDAMRRSIVDDLGLRRESYVLATLHRPSNVDDPEVLLELLEGLDRIGRTQPVIFPVHPRTRKRIDASGWRGDNGNIHFVEPLGYLDCLALMQSAKAVVTDSGGMQEETSYLGVPCVTVRPNTERPVTITSGTNRLSESTYDALVQAFSDLVAQPPCGPCSVDLWDGKAAGRIVDELQRWSSLQHCTVQTQKSDVKLLMSKDLPPQSVSAKETSVGLPLVTVVMPTYNRANLLPRAVNSVLTQTHANLELILVNDGSSDDTREVIEELAAKDSRVRAIHKPNGGVASALNSGFDQAGGKYVTWSSDDNYYHPNAIELMVCYLETHPHLKFVYTDVREVDEKGNLLGIFQAGPPEDLRKHCNIRGCLLYSREVMAIVGSYDPRWPRCQDYDFWLRAQASQVQMGYIPESPYDYTVQSESMSGDHVAHVLEHTRLLESHADSAKDRRAAWVMCYAELARTMRQQGRPWREVYYCGRLALMQPRRTGAFLDCLWRAAYGAMPTPLKRSWRWLKRISRQDAASRCK